MRLNVSSKLNVEIFVSGFVKVGAQGSTPHPGGGLNFSEDKTDDVKDSFYEELGGAFDK
jgi:hypothetical protein